VSKEKTNQKKVSRRDFLVGSSAVVGAAIGAGIVASCSGKVETTTVTQHSTLTAASTKTVTVTSPVTATATAAAKTVETTKTVTVTAAGGTAPAATANPNVAARTKKLQVGIVNIKKVQLGAATGISAGTLTINAAELKKLLEQDPRLGKVEIDVANPGENTRIVRIVNTYEPRARTGDRKGQFPFPGAMGHTVNAGNGSLVMLKGIMVHVCNATNLESFGRAQSCPAPTSTGPKFVQYDSPDDTPAGSFPAHKSCGVAITCYAPKEYEYTAKPDPFKRPINDIVSFHMGADMAGMRAAAYLGRAAENMTPDSTTTYALPPVTSTPTGMESLPKVAYISQICHTNCPLPMDFKFNGSPPLFYGGSGSGIMPTLIHPNDYIDGAVLQPNDRDGDFAIAHQNDPILMELLSRHGKDINFVGVVIAAHELEYNRQLVSNSMCINLVTNILGADGAIIFKPGGGAPHSNTAIICRTLMNKGVKAVFVRSELYATIYTNPEKFGIIVVHGSGKTQALPAVTKAIGFHSSVTPIPLAATTSGAFYPYQNHAGEYMSQTPAKLPLDDPYTGQSARNSIMAAKPGAARAADMLVAMMTGKPYEPENTPMATVTVEPPAPGIKDITKAKIAFINGGGLVKIGETPFSSGGATDGKFAQYDLTGVNALIPMQWEIHHGGYQPHYGTEDPHRLVPLDQIRALEKEGKFGSFHNTLYTWSSLTYTMVGCRMVGEGIAPLLKAAGVTGVIIDSA
jgi:sarcosine reductase